MALYIKHPFEDDSFAAVVPQDVFRVLLPDDPIKKGDICLGRALLSTWIMIDDINAKGHRVIPEGSFAAYLDEVQAVAFPYAESIGKFLNHSVAGYTVIRRINNAEVDPFSVRCAIINPFLATPQELP